MLKICTSQLTVNLFSWPQVFYTLDVSQYALGAGYEENFYYCINKALQKREPQLLLQLAG